MGFNKNKCIYDVLFQIYLIKNHGAEMFNKKLIMKFKKNLKRSAVELPILCTRIFEYELIKLYIKHLRVQYKFLYKL